MSAYVSSIRQFSTGLNQSDCWLYRRFWWPDLSFSCTWDESNSKWRVGSKHETWKLEKTFVFGLSCEFWASELLFWFVECTYFVKQLQQLKNVLKTAFSPPLPSFNFVMAFRILKITRRFASESAFTAISKSNSLA